VALAAGQTVTTTEAPSGLCAEIETAKLTLDGARQIAASRPTAGNVDFAEACETYLNLLLDRYPRSTPERNN
jgi:hypothetical protein